VSKPAAELDVKRAVRHLRKVPGPMAALIAAHGLPSFSRTRNSFESLGQAIVYQQLSGKAAGTIYARFLALFPRGRFPRPDQLVRVPVARLRSAGLSRGKASYLKELAAAYVDGSVSPRRFRTGSDAEIAAMLLAVKGIGAWSVDMFLIFALNRPDILPVGDLGVRKGMRAYFGLDDLPDAELMTRLAEPWRPYRSVASWYMWRCADTLLPG
jgi:DNA-3-methyladenine glycosylase II